MSLQSGVRLGPYEIHAAIGAGGMGEVYRAHDSRLGRDVAIKVLPSAFSSDPERLQRFEQEARSAAALNHPNILAVHDIGQHEGAPYIVAELLEGETLRERLNGGALPVRKAIDYAIQIAHGLAAAHEKGIIHRDLKPENVFVTSDGRVKILDFGLAKLTQAEPALAGLSALPTTPPNTSPGVVLGTIGYMSPEQVRGVAADHRSDIFAFGAVLYELLSGQRAFRGETTADTMSAILKDDPRDLPRAERHIPPALERIIDRCLEKDPAARFESTKDLAFALEGLSSQSERTDVNVAASGGPAMRLRERLAWVLVAACLITGVAVVVLNAIGYFQGAPLLEAPEVRLQIHTPPETGLVQFAMSPDGLNVVYVAPRDGRTQLWLQPLDSENAAPLVGTEGSVHPFWSPDSRSIAFFASGQLKRIDIANGHVRSLTTSAPVVAAGGTWNGDGTILFTRSYAGPLYRVPASGGDIKEATSVESPDHTGHVFPHFLPDDHHFLFFAFGARGGVYLASVDSMEIRRLVEADAAARFVPPNQLLFARDGALMAQTIDLRTWELAGDPQLVAGSVAVDAVDGTAAVSASSVGTIAYRSSAAERQLAWFDRTGRQIATLGGPDTAQPGPPRLSPDERTVALSRAVGGNVDIWLVETARGLFRRLTVAPHGDNGPIWSPDSTRIAFSSERQTGVLDLFEVSVTQGGTEKLLLESSEDKGANDWSSDGRYLLYRTNSVRTRQDLFALPLVGDIKPFAVAETVFAENNGRFSPDGHWIAYTSDETGRSEIYVQPFPGPGAKSQVSTDGGTVAQWRGDGKELFYRAPNNRLMAVAITLRETTVTLGSPVALFEMAPGAAQFVPSRGGEQFLLNTVTEAASPITILLNWSGRAAAR